MWTQEVSLESWANFYIHVYECAENSMCTHFPRSSEHPPVPSTSPLTCQTPQHFPCLASGLPSCHSCSLYQLSGGRLPLQRALLWLHAQKRSPPGPQQVGGHTITLPFSSVSPHLLHSSFTDIILHKTQFLLSCFQAVPSTCTCVYRYQENRDHVLFSPLSPASLSVLVLNTQQLSLNIEQTANAFNILNLKGISSKLFYLKGKAREWIWMNSKGTKTLDTSSVISQNVAISELHTKAVKVINKDFPPWMWKPAATHSLVKYWSHWKGLWVK